jgi:hypothetical protein
VAEAAVKPEGSGFKGQTLSNAVFGEKEGGVRRRPQPSLKLHTLDEHSAGGICHEPKFEIPAAPPEVLPTQAEGKHVVEIVHIPPRQAKPVNVAPIQPPCPGRLPHPRRQTQVVLVRRGHDDLPQGLGSLDDLQRREPVLVFTTSLSKHLKGFCRWDDAPQGVDLHGLNLGDAVQSKVLEPLPGPGFKCL